MKTQIYVLSFCFVLFFGTLGTAQSSGGGNPEIGLTTSSILLKENRLSAVSGKQNVIKLGLVSLFGLDPHIAYERVLTEKTTINVTVAFIGINGGTRFTDLDDDDTKLNVFTITPEYRIYFSKKDVPNGFYLGPYFRYANYKLKSNITVDTQDDNGQPEKVDVDIEGSMTTTGLGLQLGVQWVIADVVTIDWSFFGIGFNRYGANILGRVNGNPSNFEEIVRDVEEAFEDAPFIQDRLKFESDDNSIEAKFPFYSLALRTNLKVGFMF